MSTDHTATNSTPAASAHDAPNALNAGAPLDALIVGAGIAGLWSAAALRARGLRVALVEHRALGQGQTLGSQGIIHGGVKYALSGFASRAAAAIREMPRRWLDALSHADTSEVDLRSARVLARHYHLFTTGSLGSRLKALTASKVIRTSVERLEGDDRPPGLREAPRAVAVYRVDEAVLEPLSLVEALRTCCVGPMRDATGRALAPVRLLLGTIEGDAGGGAGAEPGGAMRVRVVSTTTGAPARSCVLAARHVVLAAAGANESLARALLGDAGASVRQQLRPLNMVMVRAPIDRRDQLPMLFAHCVDGSLTDKPRLTITSQRDRLGRVVWYLGGRLAEEGTERADDAQLHAAARELHALLPWQRLDDCQGACARWTRAEGLTPDGHRPDEPVITSLRTGAGASVHTLWPTKLAFAPLLGDRLNALIDGASAAIVDERANDGTYDAPADWPEPPVGTLPWDDESLAWSPLELPAS
jgi:glycine/D-amino acid oxidase-like deaminating enzyme